HDPHSYSNPEQARVDHLTLDLTVDFAKKKLVGSATLGVTGSHIVLDTRDLTIRKVSAPYSLGKSDPILGAPLTIDLPAGTKSVTIEYETSPNAGALQWLDPAQTAGKKHPYLLSQSESVNARTWAPIQD